MTIALICARGGSKGLPRKNILQFAGKPLIAHSIDSALSCNEIDRVIVSTDDHEIAHVAKEFGAEVPFLRPSELASDSAPEWLVWRHAIKQINKNIEHCKTLVVLPPTGPLRRISDISAAIKLFRENPCDIVITVTKSHRHPQFNMVKQESDGSMNLVMETEKLAYRRQDTNLIFDITTNCYVVDTNYVLSKDHLFSGNVRAVVVPPETAVDIDTALDFDIGEFLYYRKENNID